MPRITTSVPAPLVAIIVVTSIVILGHLTVPNVGGEGTMAPGLPGITAFAVPLDLNTLRIIWPTAISVAFVGLLETLLTAKLVDDLTDTRSHKGKESWALGVANIAAGFYGGIGGCAMIAQTVVNVKIGQGRTRISTAVAAIVLLVLVTGAQRADGADTDGGAGRRHDDRRAQDDRLAQRQAGDVQADADPGNAWSW